MPEVKGELHGCIVCGKLYHLYVTRNPEGEYIGSKIMSAGGKEIKNVNRPLVACEKHTDEEIERAVNRVYGKQTYNDDWHMET